MTIELSSQTSALESARAARKAYRAALSHVRAMRKAGASIAEVMAWANAA